MSDKSTLYQLLYDEHNGWSCSEHGDTLSLLNGLLVCDECKAERFCPECGADVVSNDPHAPTCTLAP